jgi:hypothetical protein
MRDYFCAEAEVEAGVQTPTQCGKPNTTDTEVGDRNEEEGEEEEEADNDETDDEGSPENADGTTLGAPTPRAEAGFGSPDPSDTGTDAAVLADTHDEASSASGVSLRAFGTALSSPPRASSSGSNAGEAYSWSIGRAMDFRSRLGQPLLASTAAQRPALPVSWLASLSSAGVGASAGMEYALPPSTASASSIPSSSASVGLDRRLSLSTTTSWDDYGLTDFDGYDDDEDSVSCTGSITTVGSPRLGPMNSHGPRSTGGHLGSGLRPFDPSSNDSDSISGRDPSDTVFTGSWARQVLATLETCPKPVLVYDRIGTPSCAIVLLRAAKRRPGTSLGQVHKWARGLGYDLDMDRDISAVVQSALERAE